MRDPVEGLEAVNSHRPLRTGKAKQHTEGLVGKNIADDYAVVGVFFIGQILKAMLVSDIGGKTVEVEGPDTAQVDYSTHTALDLMGRGAFSHINAREQFGGKHIKVELTPVGADIGASIRCGGNGHAVPQHSGKAGAQPAQGDLLAFAIVARNRYTGGALQRLGQVQIGKFTDVLGDNGLGRQHRVSLGINGVV